MCIILHVYRVIKMADSPTPVSQYRAGKGEQPQREECCECCPFGENGMNGKSHCDEGNADKENSVDHNLTAAARDLPPVSSKLPKSAIPSADQKSSSSQPASNIKSNRLRDLPR